MKADPKESGKGEYCASVYDGVNHNHFYILKYEDAGRGDVVLTDRDIAREAFAKAEMMGWNCYLFEPMKR